MRTQALGRLEKAEHERLVWQRRVKGLETNALDADMLDERSRRMLNESAPNEVILPYRYNTGTARK